MILILTAASSGGVKESWYIMRGRSNMKINNYRAAIEAFEKAVQINPDNREAMKSLGEAYEKQRLTDKAIGQYEKYFNRFRDDAEIAFKLGD
ncbi:MAG TPA: tetratricopeptide repeat protein, partial [Chitinispirillaceae bacterium]|nr:tetratricopeptide repeat protein [Chitinispirillaceae bacterium]